MLLQLVLFLPLKSQFGVSVRACVRACVCVCVCVCVYTLCIVVHAQIVHTTACVSYYMFLFFPPFLFSHELQAKDTTTEKGGKNFPFPFAASYNFFSSSSFILWSDTDHLLHLQAPQKE